MEATTCSTAGTGKAPTVDDILRTLEAMSRYHHHHHHRDVLRDAFHDASIFGMSITQYPTRIVQKIKLSDQCPCTDKFRDEMNAWLLARFGTRDESLVPRGMALQFGNTIVMRPEDAVRFGSLV